MFSKAVGHVSTFTRPVKFVIKKYKTDSLVTSAATLFFVNEDGYALTCKHVANNLLSIGPIEKKYKSFKDKISTLQDEERTPERIAEIEASCGIEQGDSVIVICQMVDCVDKIENVHCIMHNEYDLAIVKINGFNKIRYTNHALFAKNADTIQPGDMLCRLGYPFPEFSDYEYDNDADVLKWKDPSENTPRFPLDGMFTRHLIGTHREIMGIELSTPGLIGQSGGPLFSSEGIVYGMQYETHHLHLGFDMKKRKMCINGEDVEVNNQPFLHVGHCVHVDVIKKFLNDNHVKYYVGDKLGEEEIING